MSVVSATWEVEAGELLEPRRQKLSKNQAIALHTPVWVTEQDSVSKKKKKEGNRHRALKRLIDKGER